VVNDTDDDSVTLKRLVKDTNTSTATTTTTNSTTTTTLWYRLPQDFTYIHVRKAGGNTMKQLLKDFQQQQQVPEAAHYEKDFCNWKVASEWYNKHGGTAFAQHLQSVAQTTTLFTLVRNPISKFLSGMGQLMTTRKHSVEKLQCKTDDDNNQPLNLYQAPANVTIRCVIDTLKAGIRVDEHLALQSHEIYQVVAGMNVRVAVFPLDQMNHLIQTLLGMDHVLYMKNTADQETQKLKYKNPNILDETMVRELCELYAADVLMLRSLDIPVPECEAHMFPLW
jgi:hypothetical protein